jgi:isoamylase
MTPKIVPGRPDRLGATPDQRGTNFAVASGGDEVRLCLFDSDGTETQLVLPDRDGDVSHGFVAGVGPGQAYGFRVAGPFDPGNGLRYNPAKLLLDPYARAIEGDVRRQALWTQRGMSRAAWCVQSRRPSPCPNRSMR